MKGWPVLLLVLAAAGGLVLTNTQGCPVIGPTPGPRYALIVHESFLDTPQFGQLRVDLRKKGPAYDYLSSKGHVVEVLDVNATDENNQPSKAVERWKPYGDLPEMVIVAPPDKVLSREHLPPDATAGTVVEAIKKQGG